MKEIRIGLSKKKIFLVLIGSIIFIILGIQFIINPEQFNRSGHRSIEFIRTTGFSSVSFFGICLIYGLFKIFDKKPGLIINDNGIIDNSHYGSVGLIDWSQVKGIRTVQVKSTKILLIDVSDPEEFIKKSPWIVALLMKASVKMCGTPLSIASTSLNCNFYDLEKLVAKKWKKYKNANSTRPHEG